MAQERSIEVKVGALILVALGILGAFILVMGGLSFEKTYNLYVDESDTTPLPGNGPNDAYQTSRSTSLGTAESSTPITVASPLALTESTTSAGYGAETEPRRSVFSGRRDRRGTHSLGFDKP